MKLKLYKILAFIIVVILSSCTKIIEVDLNDENQRNVVDAYVISTDSLTYAKAKLSKTTSYFEEAYPEGIDNASLFIKDNSGKSHEFFSTGGGFYNCQSLPKGKPFDTYELYGDVEGAEIKARTTVPKMVFIDSLRIGTPPLAPPNIGVLLPYCYFTDVPNEKNYYRLKVFVNGKRVNNLFLMTDDAQDGEQIEYPISVRVFSGDIVNVELLCIDEESFEYYRVLDMNTGAGSTAAPGNPDSNIEGDVIGAFVGQTYSVKTIIAE